MRYLLDTNICIYFLNRNSKIVDKLESVSGDDLAISCFNLAELLFGAYNSEHVDKNLERVRYLESVIEVISFDKKAIDNFAIIKADLKEQGKLIDDFDMLIAAVALSNEMVLVTNNEKHFERITNLKIENWMH
ncbi:MAG: type II toxin-antitoxin system VapC family toxin [Oscillospiraceae bacterium]|nr:type II toxin-antitoxin system VapC family toxin [Oscillospiraceae bacterium]